MRIAPFFYLLKLHKGVIFNCLALKEFLISRFISKRVDRNLSFWHWYQRSFDGEIFTVSNYNRLKLVIRYCCWVLLHPHHFPVSSAVVGARTRSEERRGGTG